MSEIKPILKNTIIDEENHEWRPSNFPDFLAELEHLKKTINEALIFRGHRQSDWLLDSTFARSLKKQRGFPLTSRYPYEFLEQIPFQHALSREWLKKLIRYNFLLSCWHFTLKELICILNIIDISNKTRKVL